MANVWTGGADAIAAAQGRLLADRGFQVTFDALPRPPAPPDWLKRLLQAVGEALKVISPGVRIGLWVLLAAAGAFLLYVLVRYGRWRVTRARAAAPLNLHALGASDQRAARAAARLADADRLAAEGLYAEAAHTLLLRSVEDVDAGRPGLVRPSLTSRDIAELTGLPAEPRAAFRSIAAVVERALFGGRAVDAAGWDACRRAYSALVRPEAWLPA